MNELDQALEAYLKDETQQNSYYALILQTEFYVPLQKDANKTFGKDQESVRPLVLVSEGKNYMMLFDSEERLNEWAKEQPHFAVITGQLAAEISSPSLHWAINIGSKFAKEFVPEEINYLKTFSSQTKLNK